MRPYVNCGLDDIYLKWWWEDFHTLRYRAAQKEVWGGGGIGTVQLWSKQKKFLYEYQSVYQAHITL